MTDTIVQEGYAALRACPFCGDTGELHVVTGRDRDPLYYVICPSKSCGVFVLTQCHASSTAACNAWNHRA